MSDELKINLQSLVERNPDSAGLRLRAETGNNLSGDLVDSARRGRTGVDSSGAKIGDVATPLAQNFQQERTSDKSCRIGDGRKTEQRQSSTINNEIRASSAASTFKPEGAACPQGEANPTDSSIQKQPSMRPSPISGVTPPVETRWKKGQSGNPGGRCKHVSRAYIKHLETIVDESTGETNADRIAKAQINKAKNENDDGSTAAAREIRQATETDEEAGKGGFNIGTLNMAILNQIQKAATGKELE